jgi:hypothetical protein
VQVENIDRVLDRGEKIDLLVDKATNLRSDAFRFKRTTREVRRAVWWHHAGYLVRPRASLVPWQQPLADAPRHLGCSSTVGLMTRVRAQAAVSSITAAVAYLLVAEFCGWSFARCIHR